MLSSLICGTSTLSGEEEDNLNSLTRSSNSSPRKYCRMRCSSSKSNKNPYSNRGLDKFSALLAQIEEKRQQIYSKLDPNEISLVRFVYSPDRDIKPIVVKSKHISRPENQKLVKDHGVLAKLPSSSSLVAEKEDCKCEKLCTGAKEVCEKIRVFQWNDPRIYLPVVLILILMLLVLFGRSLAIMITSIGWYIIPTITNNNNNNNGENKSSNSRKGFGVRKLNEKKVMVKVGTVSFKSSDAKSQHQNGGRKSI